LIKTYATLKVFSVRKDFWKMWGAFRFRYMKEMFLVTAPVATLTGCSLQTAGLNSPHCSWDGCGTSINMYTISNQMKIKDPIKGLIIKVTHEKRVGN